MDEPALVRRVERVADLLDQPQGAIRVERGLPGDQLPEVVALDVAHCQVELAVGLACRVDRDDVRMIERRGGLRLAEEPLAEALALRKLRHQELQRHFAPEPDVLRPVDRSHPAAPEQLLQPETGDLAARTWIRSDRHPPPSFACEQNTEVSDIPQLGEYELEQKLGEGAAGVVYRARAPDGRVVAIKALSPALAADDAFRARFAREARVAQQVRHRHLVSIVEQGDADGRPYLVLEYMPGGSLGDRLMRSTLGLEEMLRVVAEVGAGLDTLHRQDLVHRDVKPSNIMLREDGSAALTDFGLAKGAAYTVLTRPGQVVGTLDYLAPELVRGDAATPASDVYALGCVAFECLAGRPPFADRSLFGVGTAHLEDDPPDPPAPADVAWVLLRALEKEPKARPPTATTYAHLLRAAAKRP
jgi:serine/threonine protein kinase